MIDEYSASKPINIQLNTVVKKLRFRLLYRALLNILPWLILLLALGVYIKLPIAVLILVSILSCILTIWTSVRSSSYQQITLNNLLQHLNRLYPELQESAQLITRDDISLSVLQALQKHKTLTKIEYILSDKHNEISPTIFNQKSIISFVFSAFFCTTLALLFIYFNSTWLPLFNLSENDSVNISVSKDKSAAASQTLLLTHNEITITPPTYTQLNSRQQKDLNVKTVEGSMLRWQLAFNHAVDSVFIEFSNSKKSYFTRQNNDFYSPERIATYTSVYRLGVKVNGVETLLPDIYTITVVKDQKAKINIILPKKTITEIATQGNTEVLTHVKVTDDFTVTKVEILASIAKGSGESVKFRDQTFNFDSTDVIDGVDHYYINWQLKSLGMEPGDELYFTVIAWDNHEPKAQKTSSSTKIIRWLEDEDSTVMFEGTLMNVMPEYFKSQRQIIIETIDLINDKDELSTEKFVITSELLGVAQRELKEKYGQYLGDEVEDGGGSHAMSHDANEQLSSSAEEDHHHDESEHHSSDDFTIKGFGTDKSGSRDVISQFGHNHEEADIGIMARQDPKALMKRSINNMWQAESHLMLSAPDKALSYEEEALKYLNMAKKAERIYVKRLGFEPPPVSEQRRYQADLNDILTYQQRKTVDLSESEKTQLNNVYRLLNNEAHKAKSVESSLLSIAQRALIVKVKKQLEVLVDKRPALIKYVAILERILLANSFQLDNCQSCLPELAEKIWQLLPEPIAKPYLLREPYTDGDILIQQYAEFLSVQP
jgi:hypothetical protein